MHLAELHRFLPYGHCQAILPCPLFALVLFPFSQTAVTFALFDATGAAWRQGKQEACVI